MLVHIVHRIYDEVTPLAIVASLAIIVISLGCISAGIILTGRKYALRKELRHLRRIGLSRSNMADQYSTEFDMPEGSAANGPIRVKAIYIHPIKSCGPIEVERALLTKSGFMYDRCFALATEVEEPDGNDKMSRRWRFISQRTKPAMSLIKTEIWVPHEGSSAEDELVRAGGCVVVTFPDPDPPSWPQWLESLLYTWSPSKTLETSFIAPMNPIPNQFDKLSSEKSLIPFAIHGRTAQGVDMSRVTLVAAGLSKLKRFLRIRDKDEFTLFKCTPDTLVRTTSNLAPLKYIGTAAVHGYTDQQPININSLSSVHAVSELLPQENRPLNALRFRANVWITGAPAYDEETWKRCRLVSKTTMSDVRLPRSVDPVLSVVCRTSRCTMPNVDPARGEFDTDLPRPDRKKGKPQPSTTLVEHRTVETGNKSALGYLGMHCVPEDRSLDEAQELNDGLYINVGDEVEVLERGEHLFGSTGNDY